MRSKNLILSLAICLFLAGPALLFVSERILHISVPEQFTAKSSEWLAGGAEKADLAAHLNLAGFETRELQTAIET